MKKLSLLASALGLACFVMHADNKTDQKALIDELRLKIIRWSNIPREHPEILEINSSDSPAKHQFEDMQKEIKESWKKIHDLQKKIDSKSYPPQIFDETQFLQSLTAPPPPMPPK